MSILFEEDLLHLLLLLSSSASKNIALRLANLAGRAAHWWMGAA
jgi:hypothetical protein